MARVSHSSAYTRTALLDSGRRRLYSTLIGERLDPAIRRIHMDALYILLTLGLFGCALAFVRLCERV